MKNYRYLTKGVCTVLLGIIIPILPALIWFYYRGGIEAIKEMWYGTITFNFLYMQKFGERDWHYTFIQMTPIAFMALLTLLKIKGNIILVVSLFLAYLFSSLAIGKKCYPHYFIIYAPLFVLTIACLYKIRKAWVPICLAYICITLYFIYPMQWHYNYYKEQKWKAFLERRAQFSEIVYNIRIEDRDSVWVYENPKLLDLMTFSDMVQCNKVFFDFQTTISDHLKKEVGHIADHYPKYILLNSEQKIQNNNDSITLAHSYEPIDSTNVHKGINNVVLYKRNK